MSRVNVMISMTLPEAIASPPRRMRFMPSSVQVPVREREYMSARSGLLPMPDDGVGSVDGVNAVGVLVPPSPTLSVEDSKLPTIWEQYRKTLADFIASDDFDSIVLPSSD